MPKRRFSPAWVPLYPIYLTVIFIGLLAIWELYLRRQDARYPCGPPIINQRHPVLGWVHSPGEYKASSPEYSVSYNINSLGMNDDELDVSALTQGLRIMVLGDSHSLAYCVNQGESWPQILEKKLFGTDRRKGEVFNCAVGGYNLGQYLLRMRQLEGLLKPRVIVIGFSMATDLYDFLPPRMGGFIYGGGLPRQYFDLDGDGRLVQLSYNPVQAAQENSAAAPAPQASAIQKLRLNLEELAIFRRLKGSKLAMWLGIRIKGRHLFLGSDVAFKKEPDEFDRYCWRMVAGLLAEIKKEAQSRDIKLALVNIPYLVQIDDDVWNWSYASMPSKYDRLIANNRLEGICKEAGIYYIDATPAFITQAKSGADRLFYPVDKHPTKRGQELIASSVYEGLFSQNILDRE